MDDRLPPVVGHVFCLAAIISNAAADFVESGGQDLDPLTLAQKILSDPRSQWAPAQEVNHD
jgi:hypothetical protein